MHKFDVRIYFEDTDAGAIVYYANYFKYMERARTEMLRHLGIEQTVLKEEQNIIFVVRKVVGEYLSSAYLDDLLTVETKVKEIRRASFTLEQLVKRDDEVIFVGEVVIVCVNWTSRRAQSIPQSVSELFLKD